MKLIEAVKSWAARHADTLRSLPIVRDLWRAVERGIDDRLTRDEELDYWLAGHSLARATALRRPGIHGPEMISAQRNLEERARAYVLQLEDDLHEFRRQAAEAAQHAQGRAEQLDRQIGKLQREVEIMRQQRQAGQAAPGSAR